MDALKFGVKYRNANIKKKNLLLEQIEKKEETQLIDTLIDLCEEEKEQAIKEKILLILAHFLESMNYSSIEKMLSSSDVFIRNRIIEIVKNSKSKQYYYIEKFSKHENKDIRKFAIDSLAQDSSEESVKIIGRALKDVDVNIQMTAVEYLGKLGIELYSEEIENILTSEKNILLKCTAFESLAKIGVSENSRSIINEFKDEKDPMLTFSFLKYLAVFGKENDFVILNIIMDRKEDLYNREFIDVVEKILSTNNSITVPNSILIKLQEISENTDNGAVKYEIMKILNSFQKIDISAVRKKLKSEDEMEILSAIEILKDRGVAIDIAKLEELADSTDNDDLLEAVGDAVESINKRVNK